MSHYTVRQFLELENSVWSALRTGDMEKDNHLLSDDFSGVYGTGFAGKAEHISQLKNGPTISHYKLSHARIQILADHMVLLSYLAEYSRLKDHSKNNMIRMYVTSIWKRIGSDWKNIFSQDTLAELE